MAAQEADIVFLKNALNKQGECRPCNYLEGPNERMDGCFAYLTELYFLDQKEFKYLFQKVSPFLRKPSNEIGWALRGYFSYLKEDYQEAASAFLEAIALAPENLDNWLDFAFSLRHLGCDEASLKIIFNTKQVMKIMITGPIKNRKTRLIKSIKI